MCISSGHKNLWLLSEKEIKTINHQVTGGYIFGVSVPFKTGDMWPMFHKQIYFFKLVKRLTLRCLDLNSNSLQSIPLFVAPGKQESITKISFSVQC